MDNMDNTMDKNTMLLEQCRREMNELAANGEDALRSAVHQSEKQARACAMEWKQAQKAVELTAQQQSSLEETRKAGEAKLAFAQAEEEDARLAVETMQRMVDDANRVRAMSNVDTAKIMAKASDVLDETARRARTSHEEKCVKREEIEESMRRLDVAEKSVLYTMAKAERNANEKKLVKLIAERRQQVCAAEFDTIRLGEQSREIKERLDLEISAMDQLQGELSAAEQLVLDKEKARDELKDVYERQMRELQARVDAELSELTKRLDEQNKLRVNAEQRLENAKNECDQLDEESAAAYRQAAEAAQRSADAIKVAQSAQKQILSDLEAEIAQLQLVLTERQTIYDQAVETQRLAQENVQWLNMQVEESTQRAASAQAEAESAHEAAYTAVRLAENATKIRETISSESSELLLHAQEVLMEAAASAKQLMEEKGRLREEAEIECKRVKEKAESAVVQADEAGLQAEMAQVDCEQARGDLASGMERLEQGKRQCERNAAEAIAAAEKESRDAERVAEEKHALAVVARSELDKIQAEAGEVVRTIERLTADRQNMENSGNQRLQEARSHASGELLKIDSARENAIADVERLKQSKEQLVGVISALGEDLEQIEDQVREASANVDNIIAMGALEIIASSEVVSSSRYKEKVALKARTDAQSADDTMDLLNEVRFSPLNEADDDDAFDAIDDAPVVVAVAEDVAAVETPAFEPELIPQAEPDDEPMAASEPDDDIAADKAHLEELILGLSQQTQTPPSASLELPVEPQADLPSESELEPETEPETEPEPEPEPELDIEPLSAIVEPLIAAEAELEAEPDDAAAPESDEELALQPEPESEPEAEAVAAAEPETFSDAAEPALDIDELEAEEEQDDEPASATETEAAAVPELELELDIAPKTQPEPSATFNDELRDLRDLSGLTAEEKEYTQRIEVLSTNMVKTLENTMDIPVTSNGAYVQWMENLAESLKDDAEKERPGVSPLSEVEPEAAKSVDVTVLEDAINSPQLLDSDMPVIQEAVLHIMEARANEETDKASVDDEELRLTVFNTKEKEEPAPTEKSNGKKRRFPFF